MVIDFLTNSSDILLYTLAVIIIFATILALLAKLFKQPSILAYILAGVILGPLFFGLISKSDFLVSLSNLGVAFLLFIVGLSLNFRVLKEVGKISLITGIGQVIFTSLVGYIIIRAIGIEVIPAIYISVALTFSSTIIIVKLLSDKKVIDTLYGRISVGFLIVQDFIAIFALILISGISGKVNTDELFLSTIKNGLFLLIFVYLFSKYFLNRLFNYLAKSQELLFMFSIAWCFTVSLVSLYFGFSIEMGAFLAGISIASLPYTFDIIGKLVSLRDFFIVLFFVYLGLQITSFNDIISVIPVGLLLSLFVLIGNPLIVMVLIGLFGYKKNVGFFTGLAVAQISEFSLILVNLGYNLGHLTRYHVSLVTFVGIITITLSSYMIIYSEKIYKKLERHLWIFERKGVLKNNHSFNNKKYDVLILGGHRLARCIIEYLRKNKKKILVVDYDPEIVKLLNKKKINTFYADVSNIDVLKEIPFNKVKVVISTIPSREDNLVVLDYLNGIEKKPKVFLTTQHMHEAKELYNNKADYVILPYLISGENVVEILGKIMKDKKYLDKLKKEQLKMILGSDIASYQLTN
ncbi:cation:proton antiporter [Candidatus Woesearchaeota archaeon]|nr:cation:proton antiporter [Candidatus Woesearchaeota archaeon]